MKQSFSLKGITKIELAGTPVTMGIGGDKIGTVTRIQMEKDEWTIDIEFDEIDSEELNNLISSIRKGGGDESIKT